VWKVLEQGYDKRIKEQEDEEKVVAILEYKI
jgi:hypothetical protein